MKRNTYKVIAGVAVSLLVVTVPPSAQAFRFEAGEIQGALDSTITAGMGVRADDPSCSLVGDPTTSCGARANTGQWSAGDNGNLNYRKGDFFTAYIKGTHELLLKMPEGWKFMARGSWMHDFKADDTARTELSGDARNQIVNDLRLLDLWVSKDLQIGDEQARIRLGNQVINWGESLFAIGGINQTNALDFQRLLVPGTQLKEAVLPAPMISFASTLGAGVNLEAYYQFRWNKTEYAPVGGYWSVADYYGEGRESVSFDGSNFNVTGRDQASRLGRRSYSPTEGDAAIAAFGDFPATVGRDIKPGNGHQYGVSMHWKPDNTTLDLGLYYMQYHDKTPVLNLVDGAEYRWEFLEKRELYGLSANFPAGNWAVGWELSYRPKDAVTLSACYNAGGPLDANTNLAAVSNCPQYEESEKYQMHLTGMLQLTPGDHGAVLDLFGADTGFVSVEGVVTRYPGIKSNKRVTRVIDGVQVDQVPAAGYFIFLDRNDPVTPVAKGGGSATSWGYIVDVNMYYDSSIIPGWQVIPGLTYVHAVNGDTPNFSVPYLQGAKAANLYVLLNENAGDWQAGLNYATYFGGKSDPERQYYKDRDFFGAFISRNF